jgi:hydroxymethylpyrimidine pyrophosphatase-like HAD family hydrolase
LIRLITIDLDGTLFDSDSKISNDNKRAISKCINSGIKIVISTGKSIKCVDSVIKELGLCRSADRIRWYYNNNS